MDKVCYFSQWLQKIKLTILVVSISMFLLSFVNANAALVKEKRAGNFYAPLTDLTNLTISGKYRFVTINGLTGFQPTSLHTKAYVETQLHQGKKGTVSFWFSPLEELDFFPIAGSQRNRDRYVFDYPFISDVFPPNQVNKMNFGIFWNNGDPQILGKFSAGGIWSKMDYSIPPFAFIEKVPMRPGSWYYLVMTWDKKARMIEIYVNGALMGYNDNATDFMESNDKLYIGCPMMVMRDLEFTNQVLRVEEIKTDYQKQRIAANDVVDAEITKLTTPAYGPDSNLKLDDSWEKSYTCSFTKESDLDGWHFQTHKSSLDSMILDITPEGLYFKTPDKIANATRLTLWGPKTFEGDQWLEVDFRLESPRGLALVIMCASGMCREDFIDDHELEMTGNMSPILAGTRNYHWEFVRRVNVIRTDMETQAVYKNPWGKHLNWSVIPKVEQNKWYKLRMIKIGNRIQGSLDGKIVFDVMDNPNGHAGPVFNFGRIGLRHMYHTTIRYRNLIVYERRNDLK